jgi:SAM-dependent methyltransferase
MYERDACAARWKQLLAPRTGDVRGELALEMSEYFQMPLADVERQLHGAATRFTEEWRQKVSDPRDEQAVVRFYNESTTEMFDLAHWHAEDEIHYRTLMCVDLAARRPGRAVLDYGSGIGSDALIFAESGFRVTLADISEPLLGFARWRCERRGFTVQTIDLKRTPLPRRRFDVALCLDVLEHISRPLRALDAIGRAMRGGGLLFVHAPFGKDPDRPMHLVHRDVVTPRMRSVGFNWQEDLERVFPNWRWAPRVYEAFGVSALDRVGYAVCDAWLPGPVTDRLAQWYRRVRPRRQSA